MDGGALLRREPPCRTPATYESYCQPTIPDIRVGKEVFASWLPYYSSRSSRAYLLVDVGCCDVNVACTYDVRARIIRYVV